MDQTSFPFMRLPTELQAGIVNHVRKYSDLKSLCLVSKQVSNIATRCLYYKIELFESKILDWKKILTLLINPANLQFVRVIRIDMVVLGCCRYMDRLLSHLQKDSLKEITFRQTRPEQFPMPHQIEYLWHNQRKSLQNLRFISHMVPWLDKFSKKEGQSGILKFFTDLELVEDFEDQWMYNKKLWPLQNLDLTVLQKLDLSARHVQDSIISKLNYLFAKGCFVNLTTLCFQNISDLAQDLKLTRMPSLKLLQVLGCDFMGEPNLVIADDIRLPSLYSGFSNKVIPLLAQVNGLEDLTLYCMPAAFAPGGFDEDFIRAIIRAIMAHKNTLRRLCLFEQIVPLDSHLEASLENFVDNVRPLWQVMGLAAALGL